jgi:hypothetical protein
MGDTTFLDAARADHTDHPADVASRLEGGLANIGTGDDVAPYAALVVHVFGEHLGEWDRGAKLLARIGALAHAKDDEAASGALRRGIAALRYAGGDTMAIEGLDAADSAQVMCVICTTHVARHDTGAAIEALQRALENAQRVPLPEKHAAIRSLAVAGNNLSAELEEKPQLTDDERAAMILAAETGLKYWKLAGTEQNQEIARQQLARCIERARRP